MRGESGASPPCQHTRSSVRERLNSNTESFKKNGKGVCFVEVRNKAVSLMCHRPTCHGTRSSKIRRGPHDQKQQGFKAVESTNESIVDFWKHCVMKHRLCLCKEVSDVSEVDRRVSVSLPEVVGLS